LLDDNDAVLTSDLAAILIRFRKTYEAERASIEAQQPVPFNPKRMAITTAIQYMVEKTGVEERQLRRILYQETTTTGFWMADQILTRLNLSHHLHDGSIRQTRARPRFKSQEEWVAYLDQIGCRR
jgi:hypothetical protein